MRDDLDAVNAGRHVGAEELLLRRGDAGEGERRVGQHDQLARGDVGGEKGDALDLAAVDAAGPAEERRELLRRTREVRRHLSEVGPPLAPADPDLAVVDPPADGEELRQVAEEFERVARGRVERRLELRDAEDGGPQVDGGVAGAEGEAAAEVVERLVRAGAGGEGGGRDAEEQAVEVLERVDRGDVRAVVVLAVAQDAAPDGAPDAGEVAVVPGLDVDAGEPGRPSVGAVLVGAVLEQLHPGERGVDIVHAPDLRTLDGSEEVGREVAEGDLERPELVVHRASDAELDGEPLVALHVGDDDGFAVRGGDGDAKRPRLVADGEGHSRGPSPMNSRCSMAGNFGGPYAHRRASIAR